MMKRKNEARRVDEARPCILLTSQASLPYEGTRVRNELVFSGFHVVPNTVAGKFDTSLRCKFCYRPTLWRGI